MKPTIDSAGNLLNEEQKEQERQSISGQEFAKPLYVKGGVTGEPERYIAEKPYDLSKYEFSILKKGKFKSDAWIPLISGATAGVVLVILGKTLSALIQKETPTLEKWELCSVLAGVIIIIILKILRFIRKTSEEKEFEEIEKYIDEYFKTNPKRRIYVTGGEEEKP